MTTFRGVVGTVGAHRVFDEFGDTRGHAAGVAAEPDAELRAPSGGFEAAAPSARRESGFGAHAAAGRSSEGRSWEGRRPGRSASDWPLVAGHLWWLIHSERTGMLQVDATVAGLGLAGGLLCELAVTRQMFVVESRVKVAPAAMSVLLGRRDGLYGSPEAPNDLGLPDPAVAMLRAMLVEPRPLPVADWLAFVSLDAYERVAERMVADGLVRVERAGRWSRRMAYPPVDVNISGWAAARLRIHLERDGVFSLADGAVVGLCLAAGLERRVFDGVAPDLVATLSGLRDGLPEPLPEILRRVEVAVAAAVVHRP